MVRGLGERQMTGTPLLLLAIITSALAAGLVLGLPQVLQGPLAKRLGKEESWTRGLGVALHVIQVPLLLISGFLIDHWGLQETVLLGSVLLAVGATLLAESRSLS